jgi:ADP-heptose:LPS heptosyltransferase
LLVSPFASSEVKDIPEDTLVRVLMLLQKEFRFQIDLCSTKDQAYRVRELSSRLKGMGIEARTVVTDGLVEFLELVSGAKAVLSPDTATAHIAAAFDLPTVAVLGGGHPGQYGPWWNSDRQLWVENRQPCAGCDWLCTQPQSYCVTTITPERIVDAMREVLRHAE